MITPETTWLSAHLYYSDNLEEFLIRAVKPFIEKALDQELAEQFFFIRYWERGTHIRLRFKGTKDILHQKLKPQLKSHFDTYFNRYPSHRHQSKLNGKISSRRQWFPNNSVRFFDYQPELERYGGLKGIMIAEKYFQASSQTILSIIENSSHWDYDLVLGIAIQLHLSFASAFDMNLSETCEFFNYVFQNGFSLSYTNGPVSHEEIKDRREKTLEAFIKKYTGQKDMLIPYHQRLWNALESRVEFDQKWLNQWVSKMKSIGQSLKGLQKQKGLIYPGWYKSDPKLKTSEANQFLWPVMQSYFHMTNNRLGVLNRDEAFLGYIIKQSLERI